MLARNGTLMPNRYRMSVAEADACAASNNGGGDYHTVASSRILQGILKRAPAVRSNTVSDIRRYRSEYSLSTAGHRVDADAPFPRKTSGTTRKLYDRRAAASLKLSTVGGEWALNACEVILLTLSYLLKLELKQHFSNAVYFRLICSSLS